MKGVGDNLWEKSLGVMSINECLGEIPCTRKKQHDQPGSAASQRHQQPVA